MFVNNPSCILKLASFIDGILTGPPEISWLDLPQLKRQDSPPRKLSISDSLLFSDILKINLQTGPT